MGDVCLSMVTDSFGGIDSPCRIGTVEVWKNDRIGNMGLVGTSSRYKPAHILSWIPVSSLFVGREEMEPHSLGTNVKEVRRVGGSSLFSAARTHRHSSLPHFYALEKHFRSGLASHETMSYPHCPRPS